jgi:predicted metal-binding membrane protein
MPDSVHRFRTDAQPVRVDNLTASTGGIRSLVALTATVGFATVCWVIALRQMSGMAMGVSTRLGTIGVFLAVWVPMMAAMMLPGAAPTVVRRARTSSSLGAVPLFVGTYLAVWTAVGVVVYAVYRPHGSVAAGVVVMVAGLYEFTPLKSRCRRRCRQTIRSGEFALGCVGSSIGLMLALVAIGVMNAGWMAIVAVLVLVQKVLPSKRAIDVPVALALVVLGVVIVAAPTSIPGLLPAM